MDTKKGSKIKTLLSQHKPGTIALAKWLEGLGISRDLQKIYRKNNWLTSFGRGAFARPDDNISWQGGLYAIQQQGHLPIHAGALTALSLQGLSHFIRVSNEKIYLFSPRAVLLPRWFTGYSWGHPIKHVKTALFPEIPGLTTHEEKDFPINISAPERAIMECLYLSPKELDLLECFHLMEGLSNLRPSLVQELLEKCASVKVKRLFLFMATQAKHQWVNFIDQNKIDLGKGDRSITEGGVYNSDFKISVPKALAG